MKKPKAKRRAARSRRASAPSKAVAKTLRKSRAELLTKADGLDVAPARVRPSYLPYLRACLTLVEQGKAPRATDLAKELGITKQSAWGFLRRHPDCLAWVDSLMRTYAARLTGLVLVRTAQLGIAGSAQHAELHLKNEAGYFAREAAAAGVGGPTQFVINNLIPRPEPLPVTETVVALPAAPAGMPPLAEIPTV